MKGQLSTLASTPIGALPTKLLTVTRPTPTLSLMPAKKSALNLMTDASTTNGGKDATLGHAP